MTEKDLRGGWVGCVLAGRCHMRWQVDAAMGFDGEGGERMGGPEFKGLRFLVLHHWRSGVFDDWTGRDWACGAVSVVQRGKPRHGDSGLGCVDLGLLGMGRGVWCNAR